MSENTTDGSHHDSKETHWERVHPLSPLARFWVAIAVVIFTLGRNVLEDVIEGDQGANEFWGGIGQTIASLTLIAWLSFTGMVVVLLGGMFWSWWFTRYAVTSDSVRLRRGLVFRSDKQARLDRVQTIEISQPFFARLVGLAELRFNVADSGDSTLHLQYLRRRDAENLRSRLLGQKHDLAREASEEGPPLSEESAADRRHTTSERPVVHANGASTAPAVVEGTEPTEGRVLAQMSVGRALGATFLSGTGLWLAVVLLGAAMVTVFVPDVGFVTFIPTVLGFGSVIWSSINEGSNFRIARNSEGFRVRHGLTSTSAQSIPIGRIQAIGIEQPWLWRFPGWFRVRINSAGMSTLKGEDSQHLLLPAGTGQELLNILPHVVESSSDGGLDGDALREALEGHGSEHGFVVAPRRSRWLDPLEYRRNGYASTRELLLFRRGWLNRRLSVIPHARTQSAAIINGPITRRLRLADVRLDSVGGTVDTLVEHLDLDDARQLIREQAERASFARRLDVSAATGGSSSAPSKSLTESEIPRD
ncbi:PH domain-containing protein [Kocuria massiliensis]|uniref:PH domain-containing protein n=1 Tax=Kocuria massiliensis TaxID=1926282 RepID=UPI000A1CB604|nr:PH domain-containing protein [Kocuria massiliensis]